MSTIGLSFLTEEQQEGGVGHLVLEWYAFHAARLPCATTVGLPLIARTSAVINVGLRNYICLNKWSKV